MCYCKAYAGNSIVPNKKCHNKFNYTWYKLRFNRRLLAFRSNSNTCINIGFCNYYTSPYFSSERRSSAHDGYYRPILHETLSPLATTCPIQNALSCLFTFGLFTRLLFFVLSFDHTLPCIDNWLKVI